MFELRYNLKAGILQVGKKGKKSLKTSISYCVLKNTNRFFLNLRGGVVLLITKVRTSSELKNL